MPAILKYKNSEGNYVPLRENLGDTIVYQTTGQSTEDVMSQKAITDSISEKQDTLISSVNIKTVNGQSVLGSGDIEIVLDVRETLTVRLESNQSSGDSALVGATVIVKDSSKNSEIDRKTWNGSPLVFKIEPFIDYEVSVSEVDRYKKPDPFVRRSEKEGVASCTLTYKTELVKVTLSADDGSDMSGQSILIVQTNTGGALASGNGSLTTKIAYGLNYYITLGNKDGYITPERQDFYSNQPNRTIGFIYKKITLGIFIMDTNKNLYTSSQWANQGTPYGIAVLTESHKFIISLTQAKCVFTKQPWSDVTLQAKSQEDAKLDLDGKNNSYILTNVPGIAAQTSVAATYCQSYGVTFFKKTGYLPALGEWMIVDQNLSEINRCLNAVGGDPIDSREALYWSSTRSTQGGVGNYSATFWTYNAYGEEMNLISWAGADSITQLLTRPFTTYDE